MRPFALTPRALGQLETDAYSRVRRFKLGGIILLPRLRGIIFSKKARALWLASVVLLLVALAVSAEPRNGNVVCREELSASHRQELAGKLRRITGLTDLRFDENGLLRTTGTFNGNGSAAARELIDSAIYGRTVVVIEDVSNQTAVAFAQVAAGRWKKNAHHSLPVFVVQIDFADFDQLVGDAQAREAFNVGWGFLHELDHIVRDSSDTQMLGETGECEAHINQMRRECNLPERADYFSVLSPLANDSSFMTRFVRLAFQTQEPGNSKKKIYWLTWDANSVGGVERTQLAATR